MNSIEKELENLEPVKKELEKLGYRNIDIHFNNFIFDTGMNFDISIKADKNIDR